MELLRFKVTHIRCYNIVALSISAIIFLFSAFYNVVYWHYVIIGLGFFSLFLSGYITTYSIFRISFIVIPQKILSTARYSPDKPIEMEIVPNLIEVKKLKFFLEKIEVHPSENYSIKAFAINGKYIKGEINNNITTFNINARKEETFEMKVSLIENNRPTSLRKVDIYIYYSKKQKSKLLKFKDTLYIS